MDIIKDITNAFGSLWKCRPRGASIEIITPFPTSTDMYVSVFLTKRDDAWIVTDGGFIDKGTYGLELPSDDRVFSRAFEFFFSGMEIKTVRSRAGDQVYYKNTSERALVPNIVFDVAQFVSQTVSIAAALSHENTPAGPTHNPN